MSAAHTKGPWFAGQLRTHCATASHNGVDIGAADGSNIAIVLHQECDRERAETIANACLIAAAPELLAACRIAIVALKGREHDGFLRAAIAKATGSAA